MALSSALRPGWLLLALCMLVGCPEEDIADDDVADDDVADDDSAGDDDVADDDTAGVWSEVDAYIEGEMEDAHIPGLAAAVTRPGEVVWTGAYGWAHVADEVPVTADTPFMLASVSKTVTGTAVMQLREDGVLDLDTAIDDLLPFAVDNPRTDGEVITVRHLVSHTSAIADNWANMPYADGDSPIALGEFLEGYLVAGGQWYDANANFYGYMPGEVYNYGNVATALAGYLPESTTGVPLDDQCDADLFAPLGMDDTGWHLADFDAADVAMPYAWAAGHYEPYGHYGYPDYPDGQLRASVRDLAAFLAAVSGGGELDGVRILEEATVDEMLSPQVPDVDTSQFVFWYQTSIGDRTVVGHNGGDAGVATEMYFSPDSGIGVIVLMNVDWTFLNTPVVVAIEELLFETAEAVTGG